MRPRAEYGPRAIVVPALAEDPDAVFVAVEDQLLSVAFDGTSLSLVGDPSTLAGASRWTGDLGGGDLIVGDGNNTTILRRLDGSWSDPMAYDPMFSFVGAVADIDGDLELDPLMVGRNQNGWPQGQPQDIRCAFGLGGGDGSLTEPALFFGSNIYAIRSGDFNDDGIADFVFAYNASDSTTEATDARPASTSTRASNSMRETARARCGSRSRMSRRSWRSVAWPATRASTIVCSTSVVRSCCRSTTKNRPSSATDSSSSSTASPTSTRTEPSMWC